MAFESSQGVYGLRGGAFRARQAKAHCGLLNRAFSKAGQDTVWPSWHGLPDNPRHMWPSWQGILGPYDGIHCSIECDGEVGEGRPHSYRAIMTGTNHNNFFQGTSHVTLTSGISNISWEWVTTWESRRSFLIMDLLSSVPKDSPLGCLLNPLETIRIAKFKKGTAWLQSDVFCKKQSK